MTLGERLYEMRRKKGLSQEQAGEALGVTRQTVSKWETDQSTPDFDKLMPICELYGISPDELITGSPQSSDGCERVYGSNYNNTYNNTVSDTASDSQQQDYEERYNKYKIRHAILLASAIFLYIVSVIPFFIFKNSAVMLSSFFVIVAIATMLIVFSSMTKPKRIDSMLASDTKEKRLFKEITSIISGVVLIIYMLISFKTGDWHITWIIWVVYAILCEIIKLIFTLKGAEVNDKE